MIRGHLRGMDGLRAIGVVCVLIAHFWPRPGTMLDFFHFGRFGVVLFFVVSGFLVVSLLLELRSRIEVGALRRRALTVFYGKRALRIFPVYYLSLLFFYVIGYEEIRDNIFWHLFYLSNYGPLFGVDFGNAGHFWTLCVEEQFYLLVPLVVLLTSRENSLRVIVLSFLVGFLVKVFSAFIILDYVKVTRSLWGSMEGLFLGVVLAYFYSDKTFRIIWVRRVFGFSLVFGAGLIVLFSMYRYLNIENITRVPVYAAFGDAPFAIFSFGLVGWLLTNQQAAITGFLEVWPVRWIGRISYGIYLYHYLGRPFFSSLADSLRGSFWAVLQPYALMIVGSFLAVSLAALSFVLIERPLLSLKKYLVL